VIIVQTFSFNIGSRRQMDHAGRPVLRQLFYQAALLQNVTPNPMGPVRFQLGFRMIKISK
jgi:hypothetical protein